MFFDLLDRLPAQLPDFTPFAQNGKAKSTALPETVKNFLIARGKQFLHGTYPQIPATAYMDFCRTGNRTRFEDRYMQRRSTLNSLVMAEFAEGRGRFLDDIVNGILAVCEESGWQLPPHNSYVRDAPQLILPDCESPVLDLFACETGAQLAMIRYLLQEELDGVSPLISKRILYEIRTRIIDPYLHHHFWWMGNGDEPMCNWTAWCTQNVLIAVFAASQPQDIKRQVVRQAAYSLDCFLKDYGEDGCCGEGAQYYRHAGLCLFNALEVLNAVTQDAFAPLYREKKIANIAAYVMNMHVDDIYYINFADCSPVAGRAGVREFLFGKRVGSSNLMAFAADEWKKSSDRDLPSEINLFYRLQAAFTVNEIRHYSPLSFDPHSEIYYPSVGIFVTRDSTFCVAVKAGDNGGSHRHNDTGSFTIYKSGHPYLIDVGVESYTKKTFSASRYEIWTMQSSYHNLPTFGGVTQKAGKEYRAADVRTEFAPHQSGISMDIAPAYPREAGVSRYRRSVTLRKGENVLVEDSFTGSCDDVMLSLMVCGEPRVDGQTISVGKLGVIKTAGADQIKTEKIAITDPRLRQAWPEALWRICVAFRRQITLEIS